MILIRNMGTDYYFYFIILPSHHQSWLFWLLNIYYFFMHLLRVLYSQPLDRCRGGRFFWEHIGTTIVGKKLKRGWQSRAATLFHFHFFGESGCLASPSMFLFILTDKRSDRCWADMAISPRLLVSVVQQRCVTMHYSLMPLWRRVCGF